MKAAVSLLLLASPIFAPDCRAGDCRLRETICAEVNTPGTIFAGTVETMATSFMSRWNPMPHPRTFRTETRAFASQTLVIPKNPPGR